MWDGLFGRRNFHTKCKMALKMIRLRMEPIMKKRKAMQKFLKNDIADLLKNNLDKNAHGRAEGLYVELNLSSCYDYVQECCKHVADNIKAMHKESECPQDCRVAVASLMHATARFSDLLELRDLRTLFTEKYGNELDHYVSKEFVEKLKSNPPTMEMKFELMKDIAKEFSITWEPTSLEAKLSSPTPQQDGYTRGYWMNRAMSDDNMLSKKVALRGLEKVVSVPYVKPTIGDKKDESNQDEAQPRPKSVRSRFIKRLGNDKDTKGGHEEDTKDNNKNALEGDDEDDLEILMDRLLRHHSTKPWRHTSTSRTEIPWPSSHNKEKESESESEGSTMPRTRSASVYTNRLHPGLPDYDELANRVEALTKM